LAYHADYEFGRGVTALPAGQAWLDTSKADQAAGTWSASRTQFWRNWNLAIDGPVLGTSARK
jgi:hypothetical protein